MELQGVETKDTLFEPMRAKYLQEQRAPDGCDVARSAPLGTRVVLGGPL